MNVPILAQSRNSVFIYLFSFIFVLVFGCSIVADYFIGEGPNGWVQIIFFGVGLLIAFYLLPYLTRLFRMGTLELYHNYIHIHGRNYEETIHLNKIKRLEIFQGTPLDKQKLGFRLCSFDIELYNGDTHHFVISLRPGQIDYFKNLVKKWNANNVPIEERLGFNGLPSRAA